MSFVEKTAEKEFFCNLIKTPSPSGFEENIQEVVRGYVAPFADRVETDVHGNVIAVRNPESPFRIMLAGHCDQIGFIISHIDPEGFVYILPLGGWDPSVILGTPVTVWSHKGPLAGVIGRKPIHLLNEDERKKVARIQDLWLDIGASSREDAEKHVAVGDVITVLLEAKPLLNELVTAPATDDKAGVWVVMEALRRIDPNKLKVGVYAVSTVQEEVGLRGSKTSAFGINPNVGIAVDVTHATDCPNIDKKQNGDIKLGSGPVIAIGPNLNNLLGRELFDLALSHSIPVQPGVEERITGTDAASIQVTGAGVATGLLSIPNRYMHTPIEIVSWSDMSAAADLLARYCESVSPDASYIPRPILKLS
ncbi:MAG: M42 family metallopeptidase [Planctomycetia bacterium]|nr:M42 family metallopeptidase [Planctomycetia bacterium]